MIEVVGGAQVQEVQVGTAGSAPSQPGEIAVVATAPGTFGDRGVAEIGDKAFISLAAYSARWMRPANRDAARALHVAGKLQPEYRHMTGNDQEAKDSRTQIIMEAIRALPKDEEHYTDAGQPRVEAINDALPRGTAEIDARTRDRVWASMPEAARDDE